MSDCLILITTSNDALAATIESLIKSGEHRWPYYVCRDEEAAVNRAKSARRVAVVSFASDGGEDTLGRVQCTIPGATRVLLDDSNSYGIRSGTAESAAQLRMGIPWNKSDIDRLFIRAAALTEYMVDAPARAAIAATQSLPAMPDVYWDLMELLAQPEATPREVAKLLRRDVAMTARLIALSNSAYFRNGAVSTTVEGCLKALGFNLFRMLAASTFMFAAMGDRTRLADAFSLSQFNTHSELLARTAKRLLKNPFLLQEAYTIGMLDDIGTLILAACLPDTYDAIAQQVQRTKAPWRDVEKAHLGTSSTTLAAYALTLWGMPQQIIEVIKDRDTPLQSLRGVGFELQPTMRAARRVVTSAHEAANTGKPIEDTMGWLHGIDTSSPARSVHAVLSIAQDEWNTSSSQWNVTT